MPAPSWRRRAHTKSVADGCLQGGHTRAPQPTVQVAPGCRASPSIGSGAVHMISIQEPLVARRCVCVCVLQIHVGKFKF